VFIFVGSSYVRIIWITGDIVGVTLTYMQFYVNVGGACFPQI